MILEDEESGFMWEHVDGGSELGGDGLKWAEVGESG